MTRRELLLAVLAAPFVPRRVPGLAFRADAFRIVSAGLPLRAYDDQTGLSIHVLQRWANHCASKEAELLALKPGPPWKVG